MVASLTLKGQLIFWAFLILLFMLGFVIFINHVDAERIAKVQKKKEAERRRKEKEIARNQQCQAHSADEPFVGSLGSKNKADLQEIAGVLSLSEDGTKDTLIQRINSFFDSNPLQRDSPR